MWSSDFGVVFERMKNQIWNIWSHTRLSAFSTWKFQGKKLPWLSTPTGTWWRSWFLLCQESGTRNISLQCSQNSTLNHELHSCLRGSNNFWTSLRTGAWCQKLGMKKVTKMVVTLLSTSLQPHHYQYKTFL